MIDFIRFVLLMLLKSLQSIFYPLSQKWLNGPLAHWKDVRVVFLLNHTSLFEFVYIGVIPNHFIWLMSKHLTFPIADKTYNRPIFGKFLRMLGPKAISITRKRDESWSSFLSQIDESSILILMPEGRMKRKSGLDKDGKPMSVRGGALEVLERFPGKKAVFVYSGGLEHVLTEGDSFPKPFKPIKLNLESVEISEYLKIFSSCETKEEKKWAIAKDLEERRDKNVPKIFFRKNLKKISSSSSTDKTASLGEFSQQSREKN